MLNEQFLNAVSGGKPVIDILGKIASVSARFGSWAASIGGGVLWAHDTMGQSGTVHQASLGLSPGVFGSTGFSATETRMKVLNSDNMQDLGGARIAVGLTAELPQAMMDRMNLGDQTHFGVILPSVTKCPKQARAEVTIPVIKQTGKQPQVGSLGDNVQFSIGTGDKNSKSYLSGLGYNNLGIQMSVGVELNQVRVEHHDYNPVPYSCYTAAPMMGNYNSDGSWHTYGQPYH